MNHILPPGSPPQRPASAAGVIVLAGALIFSLLLNATLGILYQDQRAQTQSLSERVAALENGETPAPDPGQPDLRSMQEQVARLRELRFKRAVRSELLDAASLQERVREQLTEGTSRAEFEATQRVLETLGVIEPGIDLWGQYRASFEEQVAGYYDDETGELVVLADDQELAPYARVLLAHELTHALTDQHFDLGARRDLAERGREDEAAAFLALVEGDAQLVMSLYAQQVLTQGERAQVLLEQSQVSTESFEALPRFMQEALLFPYDAGFDFARALHDQGGFAALDRAYRSRPRSTEEILHPERYLRGEPAPRRPSVAGTLRALGEGWRRIDGGDIGEFDLRLLGDIQTRSGALTLREARVAAEGWDGGAYAGFADGDDTLVVMRIGFDDDGETAEALRHFEAWLPLHFGNIGDELDIGDADGRGWQGRNGAGMVLRRAEEMLVLLGPDADTVRRARTAFAGF